MEKLYFDHMYLTNGFAVSKELIEGKAKRDYHKKSTHACLYFGFWCWSNLWDHPEYLKYYIQGKIHTIIKFFKKG